MKITINITRAIAYTIAAVFLINVTGCKKLTSYDYPPATGTAYEIISNDNNFSTFKSAVDKAGLADMLNGKDEYTIFAPTNSAFINAGYTATVLQTMLSTEVAVLVKNHIISGKTDVNTLSTTQNATTVGGLSVSLQKIGNLKYVNGGDILNPSMPITNGLLNVTNTLLVSKATLNDAINGYVNTGNAQLTYLAAAIARASTGSTNFTALLTGTTPYTLFAPNNGAFIDGGYATIAAINAAAPDVLGNILKYHLVTGAKFTTAFDSVPVTAYNGTLLYFDKINRNVSPTVTLATNITTWYANGITFGNGVPANITAKNGVLHTVSRFLPAPVAVTTLDRINSDATLTMFYALVQRASTADPKFNFAAMLADPLHTYTVFAVNNTGLQATGYANIAAINAENPVTLAAILKLHLIPKRINNISIADNGAVTTLSGTNITFLLNGGFKVQGPSNSTAIPVITQNTVTTTGLLNIIGGVLK